MGFSHEYAGCHDDEANPAPTWNRYVERESDSGHTTVYLDLQITGDAKPEPGSSDEVALLWRHGQMREFPTYTALVEALESGEDLFKS